MYRVSSHWRASSLQVYPLQLAGSYPDVLARSAELIHDACEAVDFIDINMGCPLDALCAKGALHKTYV